VIEGTFDGNWSQGPAHLVEVPRIDLAATKSDPGPAGGGGVEHPLVTDKVDVTLRVRFLTRFALDGFQVRWALDAGSQLVKNWSEPTPAGQESTLRFDRPGAYPVQALLIGPDGNEATTDRNVDAAVDVRWTVDSAVRPVRPRASVPPGVPPPPSGPEPSNYEAMSDRFPLELPAFASRATVQTSFRGTWKPGTGTDVDLEMRSPAGTPTCVGRGGAGATTPSTETDEAHETIGLAYLVPGAWTVRVGSVSCPEHFFNNAGMVPYTLMVLLTYERSDSFDEVLPRL
jgi:hypothetical protein